MVAAVLFAPHLATLGGGERVMIEAARIIGNEVPTTLFAPRLPDPARWERLGLPTDVELRVADARRFARLSARANLAVVMTNNSPLPCFAKRSILIVQFPYDDLRGVSPVRRATRRRFIAGYRSYVYSEFAAAHVRERWGTEIAGLLVPPVELRRYEPGAKEQLILSVGRLDSLSNPKRHDILLHAYQQFCLAESGWTLVIAGGGATEAAGVRNLINAAARVGAEVVVDATPAQLDDLYARASIYWHAAGYGRLDDAPELAEHFGMTTIEAMSAGAVPIAFEDGAQPEIVLTRGGRTWSDPADLVQTTRELIADPAALRAAAERASLSVAAFGPERFARDLLAAAGLR